MTDSTTSGDSPTALRRKREIAEAARAELCEKGIEGLRMRGVADRCGINVATLDYHAGGKDGLIALVAASLADDFKANRASIDRDALTGFQELMAEVTSFRTIRRAQPDLHSVMATLSRRAPNDPAIARHILPMKAFWQGKIAEMIRKGQTDGSVRPGLDPDATARLFAAALIYLGSPEQGALDFPHHAAELLKLFASEPVDIDTGPFR